MKYKCYSVLNYNCFKEIEASSSEEAAMEFHYWNYKDSGNPIFVQTTADGRKYLIYFGLVEVVDEDNKKTQYISRVYYARIWRKGGVKRKKKENELQHIANILGWEKNPIKLLEENWDQEEEEWR